MRTRIGCSNISSIMAGLPRVLVTFHRTHMSTDGSGIFLLSFARRSKY